MLKKKTALFAIAFLLGFVQLKAQDNQEQQKKAAEWVADLKLSDAMKKIKFRRQLPIILQQLRIGTMLIL
ncbi:hypothetical protein [Niabella ginsengisoli]|uniref:Uncharacterized protein n=1 Tax=Niabella ginsengisoli TaxID=522298 RepID=A0ABS9SI23_9BACT|nr:hypothetical protein [Niabella ginsengisoli]MCH5597814.1 hypothetical protein [Niabella ginsengisoli]